jgi:hypothetical protein
MIKLKDLLFEVGDSVFRPQDWHKRAGPARYYYTILKPFTAKAYTSDWEKTNQFYGRSQMSQAVSKPVKVNKGNVVVRLPGGHYLLDPRKRQAWELDIKSLSNVDLDAREEITNPSEIKKFRHDVFKNWEPYKSYFENKTRKR